MQRIVDEKAGKGEISLINGRLTEIIQDDRLKEYDIKTYSNIYGAAMGTTKESIEKFRNLFSTLADDLERLMQVV